MTCRGILLLSAALIPLEARAQITDLEDLVFGTNYVVGNSFTSKGLSFDVVSFGGGGSQVFVGNSGGAGGSGLELSMGNSIGIEFQLPSGAQQISF